MASESVDELKQRITQLEGVVRALSKPGARLRRTRLISLAGESCDYIERLPASVTVKELREKIAASRGIHARRVLIHRQNDVEQLGDDEEIHHEVDSNEAYDLCSVGDPLQLVILPAVKNTFTGKVKCSLKHADEYTVCEEEDWQEWVDLNMEERDLGPTRNSELRIFIEDVGKKKKKRKQKDVDLVLYGKLLDPQIRLLEEWGNKNAGDLSLRTLKGENAFKIELSRYYVVEKGDCKYTILDESTIEFQTQESHDAFITAFRAWELDYQQHQKKPEKLASGSLKRKARKS